MTHDREMDLCVRFSAPTIEDGDDNVATDLRVRALALAMFISGQIPAGREQALALTNLEQAVMWAERGLARGDRW